MAEVLRGGSSMAGAEITKLRIERGQKNKDGHNYVEACRPLKDFRF